MTDNNKTNKTIADHEKRKNHEGYRDDRARREDRERSATEKERAVAEDVTDAPRQ